MPGTFNEVSWSISIELFFYLIFPLALYKWSTNWKYWILGSIGVIAGMMILCNLYNIPSYIEYYPGLTTAALFHQGPLARAFEFLLGMTIGLFFLEDSAGLGKISQEILPQSLDAGRGRFDRVGPSEYDRRSPPRTRSQGASRQWRGLVAVKCGSVPEFGVDDLRLRLSQRPNFGTALGPPAADSRRELVFALPDSQSLLPDFQNQGPPAGRASHLPAVSNLRCCGPGDFLLLVALVRNADAQSARPEEGKAGFERAA